VVDNWKEVEKYFLGKGINLLSWHFGDFNSLVLV